MICKYCGEETRKEIHTQILIETKIENGKKYIRSTSYQLEGMFCSMKEDGCDVVEEISSGYKEAQKVLQTIQWIEEN